jgi:hypothetical protein
MWERPGLARAKTAAKAVREAYAEATWESRVLPDLVLVGAQRSGTTALTEALYRMPMVARPRRGKGSHFFSLNYWRGWKWFQGQFPTRAHADRVWRETGHPLTVFDACPYYLFHPCAIERMAAELPDAKVLVMLRDPVTRAESHYHHSVANGHEDLSLGAAIAAEKERLAGEADRIRADPRYVPVAHEHHSYVSKGHYAEQMRRLFDLIPREQVLVTAAESFYADPDAILRRLTDWLDLPAVSLDLADNRNAHSYRPDLEVRRALAERFSGPNEELFALLGERFDWTSP